MTPSDLKLRSGLIRLAKQQPQFRTALLPLLKEAVTQPEAGQAAERLAELLDETLGDLKDLQARVGEMGKIAEKAGVSNPWIGKLESTLKTTIREGKDFFTHLEDQWGEK